MLKPSLKTFVCDVRGHFKNQPACEKSNVGDMVWLIPEPDNEYDEFAIRVLNSNGKDLGYIPSEDNEEIIELLGSEQAEYCSKITQVEKDDRGGILPWITVYISKNKSDLPFLQENKFKLHTLLDGEKKNYTSRSIDSHAEKEDGAKHLLIGILFIAGLIFIAKLISMI